MMNFFVSPGTSRRTRATTTGACVVWGGEMPPPREHTHADASTSSPPSTSPTSIAVDMACGMAAGVAYTVTAHPFDTVKVAMQSRKNSSISSGTTPKSAIAVTSEIIKGPRGALGLFRGLTAPLVGYSIEAGVNYAAFNQARRWLEHNNPLFPSNDGGDGDASSSRSVTRHLAECAVSGALGGSLLSLVVAPTDLIKCRVQDGQFARASDAIRDVVRRNGIFGMTRGTAATLTREVPGNALFFTAYEAAQMSFPRWIAPSTGRPVTDGELIGVNGGGQNNQNNQKSWFSSLAAQEALASVVCGGLAGSAFWLAMLPVDLAKTRYQIAHPGDVDDVGVWRLIRREMRGRRGVRGLWVGAGPVLARAFPTNAVQFAAWEGACQLAGVRRQPGDVV